MAVEARVNFIFLQCNDVSKAKLGGVVWCVILCFLSVSARADDTDEVFGLANLVLLPLDIF